MIDLPRKREPNYEQGNAKGDSWENMRSLAREVLLPGTHYTESESDPTEGATRIARKFLG